MVSPSMRMTALSTTLSLLPSIRWPARTAIFFAGAAGFSCAGHVRNINSERTYRDNEK